MGRLVRRLKAFPYRAAKRQGRVYSTYFDAGRLIRVKDSIGVFYSIVVDLR